MSLVNTIQKLFPNLKDIKSFKSSSAGESLKYKAIVDNDDENENEGVIIKLSFEPYSKKYNSQFVETQIYQNVLKKLRYNTPHLPKLYGVRNFETEEISDRERARIDNWGSDGNFDMDVGQILVVKNVGPTSLWSVWEEECDNPHITFQVLYTIACFERVGLKHNDLHLNNIFIQISDEPYELNYEINGEIVSFLTTKLVKIIDYDRSCIYDKDVERNGCLDEFQESEDVVNQYNGPNNGHDTFKFLRGYKYSFVRGQLKTWLKFECPSIFEIECSNDLLGQDINPINVVPETLSLLKSLVENFTDLFSSKKADSFTYDCKIWSLPEDTAVKPIIDTIKFPVCKITRSNTEDGFTYMYKELRSLGYNWRLHHCKLFEEVKDYVKSVKTDVKDSEIYIACIHVTNPLRNQYRSNLESLILEKFKPLINIPQKYFPYRDDFNSEKKEKIVTEPYPRTVVKITESSSDEEEQDEEEVDQHEETAQESCLKDRDGTSVLKITEPSSSDLQE
jgi:hypothetical protein